MNNDIFVIATLKDRSSTINWSLGYFKDKDKANEYAHKLNATTGGSAIVIRIREYEE